MAEWGWIQAIVAGGAVAAALVAMATLAVRLGVGLRTVGLWMQEQVREVAREESITVTDVEEIINTHLKPVWMELRPNSGSSLRDRVDDIWDAFEAMKDPQ